MVDGANFCCLRPFSEYLNLKWKSLPVIACNLVLLPNLNFKSWMLSNKRSHIIEENANSSKFPCGFCPKLLKSQKKLKSHERIHTEEKKYPCGYCDKMFSQRWWSLYFRVHIFFLGLKFGFDKKLFVFKRIDLWSIEHFFHQS